MFLIGKLVNKKYIGWLHEAKGKKFNPDKRRQDPIVVTWTRIASNAKVYQTSDDAHYICEMIWGDRNPSDVLVSNVGRSEIESGELNID